MKKAAVRPFDYYALLFFATAFTGWLWEVLLYLATARTFVNRGLIKVLSAHLRHREHHIVFAASQDAKKPFRVFILSAILCTVLEYIAGAWLEWKWNIRWWDYTGRLLHLNGYVCLMSAVCFGLGGVLLICLFQPVFNKLYHHMTVRLRTVLCLLFILLFTIDAAYSVILPNTGKYISGIAIPGCLSHAAQ